MKLFITVLVILILVLTIIDKIRIRFGYKGSASVVSKKWFIFLITACVLLIGITGHQYYLTRDYDTLSKMLIPFVLLIFMVDQWRRK
jgi:hypothetical protein